MRLNKFLASQTKLSRRAIDKAIIEKQIKINGEIATLGQQLKLGDLLEFENKILLYTDKPTNQRLLIAFNKAPGLVCTCDRDEPNNIIDFVENNCKDPKLKNKIKSTRIFPIGRLDKSSRGLLLLTNDGDLTYRFTHPKFAHQKEYLVDLKNNLTDSFLNDFRAGVQIDAATITKPCFAEQIDKKKFRVILEQGYKRQIRLMTEKLGNKVRDLLRIRIADIGLANQYTITNQKIRFLLDLKENEFIEIKY
jgi:23S rRNA pseudouridine2604 synthase